MDLPKYSLIFKSEKLPNLLKIFILKMSKSLIDTILRQISEMLRTFKFYVLYIIVLTMSLAMLTATELYKELAAETIPDDHVRIYIFLQIFCRNSCGKIFRSSAVINLASMLSTSPF